MSTHDLTTSEGVAALMQTSKSSAEWDANCDKVKKANKGDYPKFWWDTIMRSGVADRSMAQWID